MKALNLLLMSLVICGCGSTKESPKIGERWLFDFGHSACVGTCIGERESEYFREPEYLFKTEGLANALWSAPLSQCWRKLEPDETLENAFRKTSKLPAEAKGPIDFDRTLVVDGVITGIQTLPHRIPSVFTFTNPSKIVVHTE